MACARCDNHYSTRIINRVRELFVPFAINHTLLTSGPRLYQLIMLLLREILGSLDWHLRDVWGTGDLCENMGLLDPVQAE